MPLLAVRHIQDFHRHFPTNDVCLEFLFALRFPAVVCSHCTRKNAYHRARNHGRYTCNCGRSQIYPRKGTLFENSPLPLTMWFYALFLLWKTRGEITARELQRKLDVSYSTAWRMMKCMISASSGQDLTTERPAFESFLESIAKGG